MKRTVIIGIIIGWTLILPRMFTAEEQTPAVQVGNLTYATDKRGVCFADDFLAVAAREMDVRIERKFLTVRLDSDEIFNYPFIVMSGEGAFTLSEDELAHMRDYLDRGGLLLASAGCSNVKWSQSFEKAMETLYPESAFEQLELDHPIFHTVYDIDRIDVKKSRNLAPRALFALMHGDRVSVVYSPLGLNDTANAGEGCCCCGGNEIRNARDINVNILTYALTH